MDIRQRVFLLGLTQNFRQNRPEKCHPDPENVIPTRKMSSRPGKCHPRAGGDPSALLINRVFSWG
ncbi:hypothetical protein AM228_07200 [Planktothricoides sp. SR001]|nr:hypothetical protein AM228_07200 [Planktothricoides sp. SR001]